MKKLLPGNADFYRAADLAAETLSAIKLMTGAVPVSFYSGRELSLSG